MKGTPRAIKRTALHWCAVSVSALLIAVTSYASAADNAPASAAGLEKPHLSIATTGSVISYYPFEIAYYKGYFKDEGLDVERSMYAGGPQTLQALLGGSADMIVSAYSNTITMAAHDQHVQAVVLMIKYPGFVLGITKQAQARYHSFADLKGMKIGVTSPGASTNVILNTIAERNGVDPKSYSVIGVGAQAGALAAAQQGQIDALVGIDPTIEMLVRNSGFKVIADLRTASGVQAAVGSDTYPEGSVIATTAFVKKNPKTVQAVVNAMLRAERFLQTATAEQIADAVPASLQVGDRATYLRAIENTRTVYSTDGKYDPKGVAAILAIYAHADPAVLAARGRIDLSATYTNAFAEAAKVKQP